MLCKSFNIDDVYVFDIAKLDNLDMAFFSYEKEISLSDELNEPLLTKQLAKMSLDKDIVLFVNFIAKIEEKKYLSVMAIDKGKILGVSDCLTRNDYFASNNQRIYMTSGGRAGVIVDADIFYPESVRNLYLNNSDFVVFMTFQHFNHSVAKALYSHKVFNKIPIISVFNDCACRFSDKVTKKDKEKTFQIEIKPNEIKNDLINKFSFPTFEY